VVECCQDGDVLQHKVATLQPSWLLVGPRLEDDEIRIAVSASRALCPNVRLAILGPSDDWKRSERWMRRGCNVYLSESSRLWRVLAVLRQADRLEVSITDRAFYRLIEARRAIPAPRLTRREEDVLELLCRGLRNRDIARALYVSENTVEFHMGHLLSKLGARTRLEAVERANALALT
jgi:DNA-binding NarL/FixJ family response regulator